MADKNEHVVTKFCVKLGKSATETLRMLYQAFGDEALGCMQCFAWHLHFRRGQKSVEDDKHSESPRTTTTPENVK